MSKQTEEEFIADFEAGMARLVARECYRAIHPAGMHTNGPTLVNIEVSRLLYVLSRWKKQPSLETRVVDRCACGTPKDEHPDGTSRECYALNRGVTP